MDNIFVYVYIHTFVRKEGINIAELELRSIL